MRRAFIAIACLANISSGNAADPSGQFAGVYVLEGSGVPVTAADEDALQLKCALAPGVMHADGFGVGYFLDRDLFRASGSISYIKGQEYRCRYSADTRMEMCESQEFSDGKSLHYYRSNVYETFTRELQRGHSLLSPEDVVAWNYHRQVNPDTRFAYHRCGCLTADAIESRASWAKNQLPSAETGKRLYWWNSDATPDDLELARQVMEALGACKPDVS